MRDYETAKWEGGKTDCDHVDRTKNISSTYKTSEENREKKSKELFGSLYKDICRKCGAIREDAQLGLEKTPEEYVANMVSVFREVWRVLKDDGVLWLNLGDSYNANTGSGFSGTGQKRLDVANRNTKMKRPNWLKPKDLVGIPWMVAFALRADGWYLRQDIIWAKPNPMPESVKDRCTKSHEYIFLLTKSAKYYYDHEAIKEQAKSSDPTHEHYRKNGKSDSRKKHIGVVGIKPAFGNDGMRVFDTRNKRSVWTVNTKPYKGAHFATFPPGLVEPMVLAGSRKGDTVLDPFSGTSTVKIVAVKHERRYAGLELSMDYIRLAKKRARGIQVQMI